MYTTNTIQDAIQNDGPNKQHSKPGTFYEMYCYTGKNTGLTRIGPNQVSLQ